MGRIIIDAKFPDAVAELRGAQRISSGIKARLAYGGLAPGLVNCEIFDISDTGMRVSTYAQLDPCPEFFSVEFLGLYHRARCCWSRGNEIGLEFIYEEERDPSDDETA
jgi:hypothetical protein